MGQLLDTIHEAVIGNITFPLTSYMFNRKRIISNYRSLIKSQWYPESALYEIQLNRLKEVIKYSNEWIPYYSRKFREIGLNPGDILEIEDLKNIPPLSRQELIVNYKEMVDKRLGKSIMAADLSKKGPGIPKNFAGFRKHRLIRNTSSGSTGAPTIFYEDGSVTALNWSFEMRFKNWFGLKPGCKEARLYRFSTDYLPKNKDIIFRKLFWNQVVLPGSNLAENDYEICLSEIKKFKPQVIWGFTAALDGLAQFIKKNNKDLSLYSPDLIICWAAPLYEHEEKNLKQVFGCPVTNIYGTREVGHIAAMCPEGSFHINQEFLAVETERISDTNSEAGEILVTTLNKTPMPFIRYRMGDIGTVAESDCSCGRKLQVLKNFLGRTGEVFVTKEGRMISPNFWCRTFMDFNLTNAVKRFQVIYKREDFIIIKIVKNEKFSANTETFLKNFLSRNFSPETRFEFQYLAEIKPQISGKYQMVVNEMKSVIKADTYEC